MKKFLIIVFAVSASLNVWSQNEVKKNGFGVFFTLDKNVSPEYIEYDELNPKVVEFDYNINNYKVGLKTEHGLNNNFAINSGINFSNKSHNQTSYCKDCDYIIAPIPIKTKIHLLEMPLSFKYFIVRRKLKMYSSIGVINQYIINGDNVDNKYIISGKLSGGLEFNLGENIALQLIAEYNHGLKSLFDDFDYKIKSISFGISLIKIK